MSAGKSVVLGGVIAVATVAGALAATITVPTTVCEADYEIQHGDTLLGIAHDQLGTVFAVNMLIDATLPVVGANPDLIYAGDHLVIPCEAAVNHAIDWSVMPSVHTLADLLSRAEVQVLDIREHPQVANGVIPGAIHLPYSVFESFGDPMTSRPSEADISEIVGLSGIRLDEPIIIIGNNPTLSDLEHSTAIYRLLHSVGADHVAILKDGYRGWVNAGLPVVTFPFFPDPYEVFLEYEDLIPPEKLDLLEVITSEAPSSFWEDVSPKPEQHRVSIAKIIFARYVKDTPHT